MKSTLGYFDQHLTRNKKDIDHIKSMGIPGHNITNCGNLKFIQAEKIQPHKHLIERSYLLFASSHEPEELLFAQLVKDLNLSHLAVIAPRHPSRATQILKALAVLNLNISRRSKNESISDHTHIYLADTLGELKALMAHAQVVIMGGSFAEYGGHNVLEPASHGKAIITGPTIVL